MATPPPYSQFPAYVNYSQPEALVTPYPKGNGTFFNNIISLRGIWRHIASIQPKFAVINPDNGPGTVKSEIYARVIHSIHNINALGYVDTNYGIRPISEVKADIDGYLSVYSFVVNEYNIQDHNPIEGFFFDQVSVSDDAGTIAYYSEIYDYVKSKVKPFYIRDQRPFFVVLNCKEKTVEPYASISDIILYEYSFKDYVDIGFNYTWEASHTGEKFWHVVHSVPVSSLASVIAYSRESGVKYIYVTDLSPPACYFDLSSYEYTFYMYVLGMTEGYTVTPHWTTITNNGLGSTVYGPTIVPIISPKKILVQQENGDVLPKADVAQANKTVTSAPLITAVNETVREVSPGYGLQKSDVPDLKSVGSLESTSSPVVMDSPRLQKNKKE